MEKNSRFAKLFNFMRLTHEQEDYVIVHESIEKGVVFKGTNLWILIFAILVASVGLNMNSPAVVIGAMLISPLMGPITGIGYSVATYNFPLFRKSLKNLSFAAGAALITSTMYFFLTPVNGGHSEILARTSPTIYDVLIGFFGGLAGIVAISSKNKGNVIPGVAIATALMPPLCTAGFGLANGNWVYFFGAMYLFLINSVYIALSAMVVTQLLKFPRQTHLLRREIKNKNIAIVVAILLTVVPSIYLGYTLVQKEKFIGNAERFIERVAHTQDSYLLKNSIDAENKIITLVYGGQELDSSFQKQLENRAIDYNLSDVKIKVEQGLKVQDMASLLENKNEVNQITNEVNRLKTVLLIKDHSLDSLQSISALGESLLKEIKPIFPNIESCAYSVTERYIDSLKSPEQISLIYFGASKSIHDTDQVRINNWLKNRLKTNNIVVKY